MIVLGIVQLHSRDDENHASRPTFLVVDVVQVRAPDELLSNAYGAVTLDGFTAIHGNTAQGWKIDGQVTTAGQAAEEGGGRLKIRMRRVGVFRPGLSGSTRYGDDVVGIQDKFLRVEFLIEKLRFQLFDVHARGCGLIRFGHAIRLFCNGCGI